MNTYEARKQARIDRLEERAASKAAESDRLFAAGTEALSHIPLGQPILIGHHSERRDRAYRGRAIGKIDRSFEAQKQADELARRAAAAASNNAISSDDPNAPDKLRERIAELERKQEQEKAVNKILQRKPKNLTTPEKVAALVELLKVSEATAAKLFEPDCMGYVGFPPYHLQNRNANIRRLRERLTEREANANTETTETEHDGFTVREDADLNRVQIIFPGKPDEATRSLLKSHGFRWAPSEGAWQRQLNANGRYAAKIVTEMLTA